MAPKSRMLQMMARVQLDVSHVSRCVTARREKVPRYIEFPTNFEVRTRLDYFFTTARTRVRWERTLHGSFRVLEFSLSNWWFSRWLGRRSVIGRSGAVLSFAGSWGGSRRRTEANTAQKSIQLWRGKAPTSWSTGRINIYIINFKNS